MQKLTLVEYDPKVETELFLKQYQKLLNAWISVNYNKTSNVQHNLLSNIESDPKFKSMKYERYTSLILLFLLN